MEHAACRDADPDIFFPEKNDTVAKNEAIKVCFGCPVRHECKDFSSRTNSEHGIWAAELKKRGKKE